MRKILSLFLILMLAIAVPLSSSYATISNTQSQTVLYGNGSTNVFSFSFVADSASDLQVIYTNATGQQTTLLPSQYLVAISPVQPGDLWGVGGTVTYPLMGSPIVSGTSITIQRAIPLVQDTSMSNQGDFYPQVTEAALDTSVMQTQQVSARTGQLRGTWVPDVSYNFGDYVTDGINGNDTSNIYMCAISNESDNWDTDLADGDWSLALNVQGIVNTNPAIPNNNLFANISGSTEAPYGVGASAFIDSAFGSTQGSILYRNATGWVSLSPGTTGQFLKTNGSSANVTWATAPGTGTVTNIATNNGITGGPITGTGTIGLATIANLSMLANTSGGAAVPSAVSASAYLDSVFGSTQGEILYRAGLVWTPLPPGTAGQFLQTGGASANVAWGVTNAQTAKAWVKFDGTLSGTNAPISGFNVTSVTHTGTGVYVVNFTIPMDDANYALSSMTAIGVIVSESSAGTSNVTINNNVASNGAFTDNTISLIVFGN